MLPRTVLFLQLPVCCALAMLTLGACQGGSCVKDLRDRETELARSLDSVWTLRDVVPREHLRASLTALRAREEILLEDARRCDFGFDAVSKHYWRRGRLKLPSRIELALEEVRSEK